MYHFINDDNFKAVKVLFQQQKKYCSACYQSKSYNPQIETAITQELIPKVADIYSDDIMIGGNHDLSYKNMYGQLSLHCDDESLFFTNFQGQKRLYEKFPELVIDNLNRNEEDARFLQMIDDIQTMEIQDFVEKYYEDPKVKGLDKMIKYMEDTYDHNKFELYSGNETFCCGNYFFDMQDKAAAMKILNFINQNEVGNLFEYKNNQFYYRNQPVESVTAWLGFRRNNTTENFELVGCSIDLNMDDDVQIDFYVEHLPDTEYKNNHLADIFYQKSYKPFLEKQFTKSKQQVERN